MFFKRCAVLYFWTLKDTTPPAAEAETLGVCKQGSKSAYQGRETLHNPNNQCMFKN